MNTPPDPTPSARPGFRTLFNRQTVFAFLAGASLAGGLGAAAAVVAATGLHGGMMMMHGTESPADMTAHIDHVLKHLYVEIDARDAQKAGELKALGWKVIVIWECETHSARQLERLANRIRRHEPKHG